MSIFTAAGEGDILNPLLPTGYDIVWSAIVAFAFIAAVTALISIYRHRNQMSGVECALWVAICLFIGGIGPVAWFVIGRSRARDNFSEKVHPTRA